MKIKLMFLSLFVIGSVSNAQAQAPNITQTQAQVDNLLKNPPQPKDKNALVKENCTKTVDAAVTECMAPTGIGFKEIAGMLTTIPAISTAFMSGEDSGKLAQMCQLSSAMGLLGSMLNGGQDKTCQNAMSACEEACEKEKKGFENQRKNLNPSDPNYANFFNKYTSEMKAIDDLNGQCIKKIQAQMQLAQQQQAANQQPTAAMQNCAQALNGDEDPEFVDCTLNPGAAECTPVSKLDDVGSGSTYEPGIAISPTADEIDLPSPEDREEYWNNLKNKASGNQANGGRPGAGAGMSGGGPGNAASNKAAGGAGRRTNGASFSAGSESGGGGAGGWANSKDGGLNNRLSKLGDKKKLNMLTQKKVAGRGLAAAEFGVASDDIWTRVYLRTNTRCTKQLVECSANRSQNPYGALKK